MNKQKKVMVKKQHAIPNLDYVNTFNEDVSHIISSCPTMSVRYYLLIRHNVVPKTVLKNLILKTDQTDKFKYQQDSEYIYKVRNFEFWWNFSIQTTTKLKHSKTYIVIREKAKNICKTIEISYLAGVNITKKVEEKLNKYVP